MSTESQLVNLGDSFHTDDEAEPKDLITAIHCTQQALDQLIKSLTRTYRGEIPSMIAVTGTRAHGHLQDALAFHEKWQRNNQ
jgi:hypothetical protein